MIILFLFLLPNTVNTIELTQEVPTGPSAPSPVHGVDFIGPLWLPRTFKITCCRGGVPKAENDQLISNWTQSVSDYAVDERDHGGNDEHCRVYEGSFLLSATALFNFSFTGYGIQCKCPAAALPLDRHCRRLPPCQNGGYRSSSLGGACACSEPHFGDNCEKTCDQGQTLKGVDGRSYCSCLPFYQGDQCTEMVCLNGGVEVHGRCSCPPSFLGYHCEVDSNRTAHPGTNRFQRFGESNEVFSRDISGTVFSLVMIVVLVVSMYLLMKHRMQVQSRFAASRRDEMARAAAVYGLPSRDQPGGPDMRIAPFVAAGIEGPPPYMPRESRAGRGRNEILPPLPTYEDATKDLPLRPWVASDHVTITPVNEATSSGDQTSSTQPIEQTPEATTTTDTQATSAPAQPPPHHHDTTIERKVSTRRSF